MNIKCQNCGTVNRVASPPGSGKYRCGHCGAFLPQPTSGNGDTSAAVGLMGGAALGAALGGPIGAIVGGVIGAILGKESKGVG